MNLQQCLDLFVVDAEDVAVPLRPRLKLFERRIRMLEALHGAQQRNNAALVDRQARNIVAELPRSASLDRPLSVVTRRDLGRLVSVLFRIKSHMDADLLREEEADARCSVRAKFHELAKRRKRAGGPAREQIDQELLGLLNSVPSRSWVPRGIRVKVFVSKLLVLDEVAARKWLDERGFRPEGRRLKKDLKSFLGKLIDSGVPMPEGIIAVDYAYVVTA